MRGFRILFQKVGSRQQLLNDGNRVMWSQFSWKVELAEECHMDIIRWAEESESQDWTTGSPTGKKSDNVPIAEHLSPFPTLCLRINVTLFVLVITLSDVNRFC